MGMRSHLLFIEFKTWSLLIIANEKVNKQLYNYFEIFRIETKRLLIKLFFKYVKKKKDHENFTYLNNNTKYS